MNFTELLKDLQQRNSQHHWHTDTMLKYITAIAQQIEANRLQIQELRAKLAELTEHYKGHEHRTSEGMNVFRPKNADFLS